MTWALVLAPDGEETATTERLVMLRSLLQVSHVRVLVAFADMSPTDGFTCRGRAVRAGFPSTLVSQNLCS